MAMRVCVGILATATTLFAGGASGALGTWALSSATVIGLVGAIATVTVMEAREHAHAMVTTLADRRSPVSATELEDVTLELGHQA